MSVALLSFENKVYSTERTRLQHEPFSSVSDLIQGIWAENPALARKILRNRIYSTETQPREMDHAMIKVAAKRASFGLSADELEACFGNRKAWITLSPPPPPSFDCPPGLARDPMSSLRHWLDQQDPQSTQGPRYIRNRRVAAALISNEGFLLGSALNSNAHDRTRHAEVNLIQSWWLREKRPIPPGTQLYVTLRCCRMCAALLWEACEDPWSLKVYWLEDDPGPLAQETLLQVGTQARRRVAGTPDQLTHIIERPID
jgi:hypothetical protein